MNNDFSNILIETIKPALAESLCRKITIDLPEYFGLPEANEHYAVGVTSRHNFAAKIHDQYVGLISIDFPYKNNANIYWMAVLSNFHSQGIGKKLLEKAFDFAKKEHAKTMSVETLSPSESDENYLKTWHFYKSQGFLPLFDLKPEGYEWNMVYMAKNLEAAHPVHIEKNIRNNHLTRSVKKEDLNALFSMLKDLVKHEGLENRFQMTRERLEQELFGLQADWYCLIATDLQDNPVGFCLYSMANISRAFNTSSMFQIDDFYVKPAWRRAGVGQSLLFHLASIAEKRGAGRINLLCVKDNEQGQNFYKKIGAEKRDFVDLYSIQVKNLLILSKSKSI